MRVLNFFIRLVLYWLILFSLGRMLSIIYQFQSVSTSSLLEIPLIFVSALRLDMATITALLIVPFLVWLVHEFTGVKKLIRIVHVMNCIIAVLVVALLTGELELVREWGTKVNFRALTYLAYPKEALASASAAPLLLLFAILVAFSTGAVLLYRRLLRNVELQAVGRWPFRIAILLLVPPLFFLGVRGGWQQIGINTSSAYFSANRMNNMIAVNPAWSLVESIYAARSTGKNPYAFFPADQARSESRKLFKNGGAHAPLFTQKKPNVVLLILESWTADVVQSLGGEVGVAPNFEKLISQGLLYTKFYSSGARSQQGLVAVLSAFPAMSSAIHDPRRMQSLPCLAQEMERLGYSTSFLYGGDLNFANFRAYMTFCGFDSLTGVEDFPKAVTADKWGAHDEFVLDRQINLLSRAKEPFFSTLFTLSSHEPFKVPMETPFKGQALADQFRGSIYYSDHSLGQYFEKVKNEPWYKNTVFILVADHGHRLPREKLDATPERYHIPLLILGEPLRPELRGTKIAKIGSQVDIVATLLTELGLSSEAFRWSKDLRAEPGASFAYYSFEDGFGLIQDAETVVYDDRTERWMVVNARGTFTAQRSGDRTDAVKPGQAMMQAIYQDYLELR
ncbi:MAG: sulfatase-like hydrolase/transferase [Leptospirales bacterium]|nr:sulfatase-like hydrolase/transferase [Leptospirales bacterium]